MIFKELFNNPAFIDRYCEDPDPGLKPVDVIVPLKTVNCLFEHNLLSWYRELPIRVLLIGDSGISKDVLDVIRKFPRVIIIDQDKFQTLGFCIKYLIGFVHTESFVYLHADTFLPPNWYDMMRKHGEGLDWAESGAITTVLAQYIDQYEDNAERAFSGAQVGNTAIVKDAMRPIQDDYVYRTEDILIRELIEARGGRYGRIKETRYYHEQVYDKPGSIHSLSINKDVDKQKESDMLIMQIQGILKYAPRMKLYLWKNMVACFIKLVKLKVSR